jgi:hypothetical protein
LEVFLKERSINFLKSFGVISYSASNFFGVDNGLFVELEKENPRIVDMAYVAHNLNTMLNKSFEEEKAFVEGEKTIIKFVNYFNYLPAGIFKLKETGQRIYEREISLTTN